MGNNLQTAAEPQELIEQNQQQSSDDEKSEFTCEICIEPAEKKFKNTNRCCHPFCTDCMIKYIAVEIEVNNLGEIKCPALNCDRMLDPVACASLIGGKLFVRWCDLLCESAIVDLEKCYCPYGNCNVLIVNECGGNVKESKCPSCKRRFCFECKRVWHAGFGCAESGEIRDRNDVAFGRLVEQNKWRRCPRCRHFVELMEGCHIVRCRCQASFCYRCGQQVETHWCRCITTSIRLRRVWCFRICITLIFLKFALFLLIWAIIHHWLRK